jgi:hypothetical protein
VTETEAALARGEAPDPGMVAEILKEAQRARAAEERLRKAFGDAVRLLRDESSHAAEAILQQALEIR